MSKLAVNEAVLHQVLYLMRTGQLQRCVDLGLDPETLGQLQHPSILSVLANSPVNWVQITIDLEMVKRLMSSADRSDDEKRMIERAIRLGATSTMLHTFFGLTPQEAAMLRSVMGVKPPRGRWREPSEDTDRELWYRWIALMKEHQPDLTDSLAILDVSMLVAEELRTEGLTLGAIWNRVTGWISSGAYKSKGTEFPPQPALVLPGQVATEP